MMSILSGLGAGSGGEGPTDAPLEALPAHEERALGALGARARAAVAAEGDGGTDAMVGRMRESEERRRLILLKFLRARALDVEKALEMLTASLRWRRTARVNARRLAAVYRPEAACPFNILPCRNDAGQALLYACMRFHEKKKLVRDHYFEGVMATLEHLFYRKDGLDVTEVVVVLDFEGWSPIYNVDLTVLRQSMLIVFENYPERLGGIYLVNYPVALYGIYKIVEPIIDTRTRKRINWVKNPSKVGSLLARHFDREVLPDWLGGRKRGISPDLTIKPLDEEALRMKFAAV